MHWSCWREDEPFGIVLTFSCACACFEAGTAKLCFVSAQLRVPELHFATDGRSRMKLCQDCSCFSHEYRLVSFARNFTLIWPPQLSSSDRQRRSGRVRIVLSIFGPKTQIYVDVWQMLDSRFTLREACRTCISTMCILAIWTGGAGELHPNPTSTSTIFNSQDAAGSVDKNASTAALGISTPSARGTGGGVTTGAAGPTGGGLVLVSAGSDDMGPEEFARAVYHCGDTKTRDGMCPVSRVIKPFDIEQTRCRLLRPCLL